MGISPLSSGFGYLTHPHDDPPPATATPSGPAGLQPQLPGLRPRRQADPQNRPVQAATGQRPSMEPGSSEADRRPSLTPGAAAGRDQQDRNGTESGHRQTRAIIDVQPGNPEDRGSEQIYTWDSQHENLHLFHSRNDADQFVWQEYRKQHPDAPEQSHIDNGWDVFRRGSSDTLKNPVGQVVSQIARFAGSSPETQKILNDAGNNVLGFLGAELSAASGASPETQNFFRELGEVVEHLIPVWGGARTLSGILGKAANGEELSLEDHQSVQGLFKDLLSGANNQTLAGPSGRNLPHGTKFWSSEVTVPVPVKEIPPSNPEAPGKVKGSPAGHESKDIAGGSIEKNESVQHEAGTSKLPGLPPPSEAGHISFHAVPAGGQLIHGKKPNEKGIYQTKDNQGADHWYIRYTDSTNISGVYEIRSDFKLADNRVNIVDPETGKAVMTVHSTGNGQWKRIPGLGGADEQQLPPKKPRVDTSDPHLQAQQHNPAGTSQQLHPQAPGSSGAADSLPAPRFSGRDGSETLPTLGQDLNKSGQATERHQFKLITPDDITDWQKIAKTPGNKETLAEFAMSRGLDQSVLQQYATAKGELTPAGKTRLLRAGGHQFKPTTPDDITDWLKIAKTPGNKETLAEFAMSRGLNQSVLQQYATTKGELTADGETRLLRAGGYQFRAATLDDITDWQKIAKTPGNKETLVDFAMSRGLAQSAFQQYVSTKGELTADGENKVLRAGGHQFKITTPNDITDWQKIANTSGNKETLAQFAMSRGLSSSAFQQYVTTKGEITPEGKAKLMRTEGHQFKLTTAGDIADWQKIAKTPGNKVTIDNFVMTRNIDYNKFIRRVDTKGNIKDAGKIMMFADKHKTITAEDVTDWQKIAKTPGNTEKYLDFTRKRNINDNVFRTYVAVNGDLKFNGRNLIAQAGEGKSTPVKQPDMPANSVETTPDPGTPPLSHPVSNVASGAPAGRPSGDNRLEQSAAESVAGPSRPRSPADDDVVVKIEAPSDFTHEVSLPYNDNLPTLRKPGQPTVSMLEQSEGKNINWAPDKIEWNYLEDVFKDMPRRDISAAKNKISEDAMEWLDKESSSGPINRSEEFDKIIEVRVPDDGPPRGFSLFSRRPIRQFEVLGSYAGTFYGSVQDLNEASRKTGHGRTVSYAWEGKQLGQQVDARESGNRLALMNTARLPGHADLLGKENNVAAIRIGNSLWFYVAIRDIDEGEELLVDYGPAYNPSGIKIEPDQ